MMWKFEFLFVWQSDSFYHNVTIAIVKTQTKSITGQKTLDKFFKMNHKVKYKICTENWNTIYIGLHLKF